MTQEAEANDVKKSDDSKKIKIELKTKVVIRRLPPTLTSELFLESIEPLLPYNYYNYVNGEDNTIFPVFSRAYINFVDVKDVWIFQEKFDGYVFMDNKGNEYPAVVEYAPYSKIPKIASKKPDARINTIENDVEYLKFLSQLNNQVNEPIIAPEAVVEEIQLKEKELKANKGIPKVRTPLVDFLYKRKEEKELAYKQARDDRRKESERQKTREERSKKDEGHDKVKKVGDETRGRSFKEGEETHDKKKDSRDDKKPHHKDVADKQNRDKKETSSKDKDDKVDKRRASLDQLKSSKDESKTSFSEMIVNKLNESRLKQMEPGVDRDEKEQDLQSEKQITEECEMKANKIEKKDTEVKSFRKSSCEYLGDDVSRGDIGKNNEDKKPRSIYDQRSADVSPAQKFFNRTDKNKDNKKIDNKGDDTIEGEKKLKTNERNADEAKIASNKIKNKDRPERAIYVPSHRRK